MTEAKIAPICYIEIPSPDPPQSAAFYRAVFGWTAEPSALSQSRYWMFQTGKGQLTGGFDASKQVQENGIVLYISVDDIDLSLKAVGSSGGTVVTAKESIGGGYGFTAMFKDPHGNLIGLFASK